MTPSELVVTAAHDVSLSKSWATRLHDRAKSEQWSVDEVIDWPKLNFDGLALPLREALGRIYTQVHAGEAFGLVMAARAVDAAPQLWAKLFGATQVMDEARHVEFFARLVSKLHEPMPLNSVMVDVVGELGAASSIDELLLGTQVLLEGYVQCLFAEGARLAARAAGRRIRLPGAPDLTSFLHAVSEFVARDESRHIAFGVLYLRDRWRQLPPVERSRLQQFAYRSASALERLTAANARDLRYIGVEPVLLAKRARQTQTHHFRCIGFDT